MTRTLEIRFVLVRNGADFAALYPIDGSAPTLRMTDSGDIKTSLSGEFAIPEGANWLTDQIRPELWIDGTAHPLGVFYPATVREQEDETSRSVSIEAYDRGWVVRDTRVENSIAYSAGANYLAPVQYLLTRAGITTALITPTSATLAEARGWWEPGISYLDIINELLGEINYNALWFDAEGTAIVEPASVPTAQNIDHVLNDSDIQSLLLPTFNAQTDVYSAPNVFIVTCSNPDKSGPMVATAVNDNPQSPLSTARRGRRICRLERVDNIASQEELQAYANRLRTESLISGETLTVQTALLPGFGVGDVTALHYGEFTGICIERSWTMELRVGGTMTHTMEKVVLNLD